MKMFRNPIGGIVVPGLLLIIGAVSSLTDQGRRDRQALARDAAQTAVQERLETAQTEARDRLAVSRYQGPCAYIPDAQLTPGMALLGTVASPCPMAPPSVTPTAPPLSWPMGSLPTWPPPPISP
ncbi:MAG: hypothetical protein HC812_13725 [Leptolyngbya sp. RL_3_1]|nr:hypothetical protein [Leptolyngbya sp. RL_3_1]